MYIPMEAFIILGGVVWELIGFGWLLHSNAGKRLTRYMGRENSFLLFILVLLLWPIFLWMDQMYQWKERK